MCSRADLTALVDAFRAFHNAQLRDLCGEADRPDLLAAYEVHITNKASPSDVTRKRQKRAESDRVHDHLDAIFARRALPTMTGGDRMLAVAVAAAAAAAPEARAAAPGQAEDAVVLARPSHALAAFHDALCEFTSTCGLNGFACEFGEPGSAAN